MEGGRANYLSDTRVVELADEQGEYCGRVLAGLGADVVKVEPPGGSPTRNIGPYYEDEAGPDRSLYFWHYNLAKRSVTADLDTEAGRETFLRLLGTAEVFLDSSPRGYLESIGLGRETLEQRFPGLIIARITPFGDDGPWAGYKASDLVHLALGGPMMDSGYDPEPGGHYDLPPIAPQMWHAYHIAGELMAIAIMGARLYQRRTGKGQYLSEAVHEAVVKNTEGSLLSWLHRKTRVYRQTGRHASAVKSPKYIGPTKDGRWFHQWIFNLGGTRDWVRFLDFIDGLGMVGDLREEKYIPTGARGGADAFERNVHANEVVQRIFDRYTYDRVPWKEAQAAGLLWVPVRKPHENALDEHWRKRRTFAEVEHPELDRSFTYPVGKWVSSECDWVAGPRAPLPGEHTDAILAEERTPAPAAPAAIEDTRVSKRNKPFALDKVRILDFTWLRASGGAARFLTALGAEDIKVEWKTSLDGLRGGPAPIGVDAPPGSINTSGDFHDMHAGHRSISLNVRDPRGLEIARKLVRMSDIVAEGFSPGVLDSWGLGYDQLRKLRPDIIYVSQSGMGASGEYGKFRAVGPTAQSLSSLTEMSGLPDPAPPAGWGYSYLDWFGAYNLASAMLAALNYREQTGLGQWIDSSQVETGIYVSGTAVLDYSANGRVWTRYGNRSPYKPAAPHGAYRCAGDDRWIAIACFTEEEWRALVKVAGEPGWADDSRFATLEGRLAHQDALDAAVTSWTAEQDAYALMEALQAAGVPAGVCQHGQDIVERDPQLPTLDWLTYSTGTAIGHQPGKEIPVKMSATPPYLGGAIDRGAPLYGEDNEYVLGELLGMSSGEIATLREENVI